MYERFTDRARKVMQLANQEAQRFKHEYIGTEHLLLGLVKEGGGVGATVLKNLDIDLRKIRLAVEKVVPVGPGLVATNHLPQTPRTQQAIAYAREEAHHLHHNYVGTEHLLLGLLREQEGVGAQVLMNFGLNLEAVREEIRHLLGHPISLPGGGQTFVQDLPAQPLPVQIEEPTRKEKAPSTKEKQADARDLPAADLAALKELDAQIEELILRKEAAVSALDFDKAAGLLAQANQLKDQSRGLLRQERDDISAPAAGPAESNLPAETALYERFTGQARRVMLLAHREAHRFSHDYLGTEHVLLGVLQETSGGIGSLLAAFAVAVVKVRQEVEKTVQQGAAATAGAKLPLTPPARRALQFARAEATRLRHDHVGPEHLLLGLLHEPEGEAVQVLLGLALDLDRLRAEVFELPPPENRDSMLQPAPKPGGAVAADPSARAVAELVTADLGTIAATGKEPVRKRPGAVPLLGSDPNGLALQLRVTQHTLGALTGVVVGALLAGPGGAVLGILGGLALAAVRNAVLAATVCVGLGLVLGFRYYPGSLATHLLTVLAGVLIGACLGGTWRSHGDHAVEEEESHS